MKGSVGARRPVRWSAIGLPLVIAWLAAPRPGKAEEGPRSERGERDGSRTAQLLAPMALFSFAIHAVTDGDDPVLLPDSCSPFDSRCHFPARPLEAALDVLVPPGSATRMTTPFAITVSEGSPVLLSGDYCISRLAPGYPRVQRFRAVRVTCTRADSGGAVPVLSMSLEPTFAMLPCSTLALARWSARCDVTGPTTCKVIYKRAK